MAGPAAGRPLTALSEEHARATGVSSTPGAAAVCWPAAAVPVMAKIPRADGRADAPRAVRSSGPSARLSLRSGASASATSRSGLLVRNSDKTGHPIGMQAEHATRKGRV